MNKSSMRRRALALVLLSLGAALSPAQENRSCRPTPSDALGPFYQPGAPQRESVGKGYLLARISQEV